MEILSAVTNFSNGKFTVFDTIKRTSIAECETDDGTARKVRGADDDHLDLDS